MSDMKDIHTVPKYSGTELSIWARGFLHELADGPSLSTDSMFIDPDTRG